MPEVAIACFSKTLFDKIVEGIGKLAGINVKVPKIEKVKIKFCKNRFTRESKGCTMYFQ